MSHPDLYDIELSRYIQHTQDHGASLFPIQSNMACERIKRVSCDSSYMC